MRRFMCNFVRLVFFFGAVATFGRCLDLGILGRCLIHDGWSLDVLFCDNLRSANYGMLLYNHRMRRKGNMRCDLWLIRDLLVLIGGRFRLARRGIGLGLLDGRVCWCCGGVEGYVGKYRASIVHGREGVGMLHPEDMFDIPNLVCNICIHKLSPVSNVSLRNRGFIRGGVRISFLAMPCHAVLRR